MLIYFNQEIYESWFGGFFSINAIGAGKEGLAFIGDYFESFRFGQILYFIPLGLVITAHKLGWLEFEVEYNGLKQPLALILVFIGGYTLSLSTISQEVDAEIESAAVYTDHDLYIYLFSSQSAVNKFGLLTYTYRDIMNIFLNDPLSENEYELLKPNLNKTFLIHNENSSSILKSIPVYNLFKEFKKEINNIIKINFKFCFKIINTIYDLE